MIDSEVSPVSHLYERVHILILRATNSLLDPNKKKTKTKAKLSADGIAVVAPAGVDVVTDDPGATSGTRLSAGDASDGKGGDAAGNGGKKKKAEAEPQATFAQVLSVATPGECALFLLGCFAAVCTGMGTPLMSLLFGRNVGARSTAKTAVMREPRPATTASPEDTSCFVVAQDAVRPQRLLTTFLPTRHCICRQVASPARTCSTR